MTNHKLETLIKSIYQVPERINQLDETTTAELIYHLLKQTHDQACKLIKQGTEPECSLQWRNDLEVMERLFVQQNRKFEPAAKRLSEPVLQSHFFDTAMYAIKVLKMENIEVAAMFDKMLNDVLSDDEKNIIQSIIDFLRVEPVDIFINPDIIETLFNDLKQYFEVKDHFHLNELLKGKQLPGITIVFKGTLIQLVNLFRRLERKRQIVNSKKDIERWLVQYFEFVKKKKPTPLKGSLVYNYLSKDTYSEIPEKAIICNWV